MALDNWVLIYQYFDNQEIKLVERINEIQSHVLYRDPRDFTIEESQELSTLKIKLEFCRQIAREVLHFFIT